VWLDHGGEARSPVKTDEFDHSALYANILKWPVHTALATRFRSAVSLVRLWHNPPPLAVETFGTGVISEDQIGSAHQQALRCVRPAAIIRRAWITPLIHNRFAAYGHWRASILLGKTDEADALPPRRRFVIQVVCRVAAALRPPA